MVIHDDSEIPEEVSIIKQPLVEPKSYVFAKNLGQDHINTARKKSSMNANSEKSLEDSENVIEDKARKRKKKSKKNDHTCLSATESDEVPIHSEISANDLEELRSVYEKCKAVMRKIESKYGHLLNLDEAGPSKKHNKQIEEYEDNDSLCTCMMNKKIVFDEDGKEIFIESVLENHICPKKKKLEQHQIITTQNEKSDLQIEYPSNYLKLSDNLQELASILRNPDIETTYRNSVINKIRSVRMELLSEVKFNKPSLVEKLKTDPDKMLDFKGTNLSTISGYI